MKVTAQYAESHIADLLQAADSGEEVEIARPDQPTYRLTPVKPSPKTPSRSEMWGAWEGLVPAPSQDEWDILHQKFLSEMPNFSKASDGTA
jgi:antitoxin (DNA-binding transcriptional repressor) of toxin-antitoxin stability system